MTNQPPQGYRGPQPNGPQPNGQQQNAPQPFRGPAPHPQQGVPHNATGPQQGLRVQQQGVTGPQQGMRPQQHGATGPQQFGAQRPQAPVGKRKGFGGTATVLGSAALLGALIAGWFIPVALVAIVVGIVAVRRPMESTVLGGWGIALGAIATVYSIGWLVFYFTA